MKRFVSLIFILIFLVSCGQRNFNKMLVRAEEQVGLGNFEKAANIYEELVSKYPKDPRSAAVLLQLGDLYANSIGDAKSGLESYQKCIEKMPQSEAARLAHERSAILFEREGCGDCMVQEYTALLKYFSNHPDTPKYQMGLGEAYITGGQFQQARTELRGFVEKTGVPEELRLRALFDIGETYFLEGKPGKAVRFYYALAKESSESPLVSEAMLRIATCLEEMGYLGAAHKFAEGAEKNYPNLEVIKERLDGLEKRGKGYSKKATK